MNMPGGWITACIPTFRCTRYLRRAVTSLVNQTYPFLRIVVINDGDPEPPWPAIADIVDPRVVRFDLNENKGPYFSLAIALEATPDSLFLVQDADDWSEPHRVATLLRLLQRDVSDFAFSTVAQFHDGDNGSTVLRPPLFPSGPDREALREFRNRLTHTGLFRTHTIKQLGGYYGGFRFGYDMLMTSLLLLVGSVSWTPAHLYWRRVRGSSLSHAPDTGWKSLKRRSLRAEMREIYRQAYLEYEEFVTGRISGRRLLELIRWRIGSHLGPDEAQRIQDHAARLRHGMNQQSCFFRDTGTFRSSGHKIGFQIQSILSSAEAYLPALQMLRNKAISSALPYARAVLR